jgi:predicted amidohydrolase
MTYSKVHTLDFFKMEASFEPGEGFDVVELDTRFGPVKTGIMICYDREFPESARVLMLKGAELILTPNACGLDPLRINQFQTRAWENAVVCAMANYAEGQWYNGRSCAYNANGDELFMAGESEGVFMVDINMVEAREIREDTYWGNAFRRPHKYDKLTSFEVEAPFTRENVFGEPFEREKR